MRDVPAEVAEAARLITFGAPLSPEDLEAFHRGGKLPAVGPVPVVVKVGNLEAGEIGTITDIESLPRLLRAAADQIDAELRQSTVTGTVRTPPPDGVPLEKWEAMSRAERRRLARRAR